MKVCLSALFLALAVPALAQEPVAAPAPVATPSPALPRVVLDTSAGRIVIEVETAKAPISANNFLKYVDQKKLDGVEFYRAVKAADHFGFVQFGANGEPKRLLPPIAHEPTTQTGLHHTDGEVSLARLAPGAASSRSASETRPARSMQARGSPRTIWATRRSATSLKAWT
jgi:peptidyl-prolyl cis-trans isomerase A (cyclophilin A)